MEFIKYSTASTLYGMVCMPTDRFVMYCPQRLHVETRPSQMCTMLLLLDKFYCSRPTYLGYLCGFQKTIKTKEFDEPWLYLTCSEPLL